MKTLTGIGIGLAGFFLLVSLVVLGPVISVRQTALSPRFAASELEKLEAVPAARDYLVDLIPASSKPYAAAFDRTIAELEPWIYGEMRNVLDEVYDYVLGRSSEIRAVVPVETFTQSLVANFAEALRESPPPEYRQMSAAQQDRYISDSAQQLEDLIPLGPTLEVDEELLGEGLMARLDQARTAAGLLNTFYIVLIVLAVICAAGIAGLFREIRSSFRSLGIIFLGSGILGYVFWLIAKAVLPGQVPTSSLPEFARGWVPQIVIDLFSPWGIFNLAVLAAGAVMLAVSFLVRARPASDPPAGSP